MGCKSKCACECERSRSFWRPEKPEISRLYRSRSKKFQNFQKKDPFETGCIFLMTMIFHEDDLTLHIVGLPTIVVALLEVYFANSSWGFFYTAALYLSTCQNLYQIRMLQIYCDQFNDKKLSKAMSAHFVLSTDTTSTSSLA